MTGAYTVPTVEQERLLRELGMDPAEYAVKLASEETLWLLHYRTRHEVVVHINRRVAHEKGMAEV